MKIIGFSDLYATDFNLSMLAAYNQRWSDKQVFEMTRPRKSSAFLYFKNCDGEYIFEDGRALSVSKGDVVYIPQNSVYKTRFLKCSEDNTQTQLIEFELRCDNEIFCISDEVFVATRDTEQKISYIFTDTADIFAKPIFSYSSFKAAVYTLLCEISKRYRHGGEYSKEFKSIAPAIEYLEKNTDFDNSIADLAKMCFMSDTYFRIQFKKCIGVSPLEYCTKLKVSIAKRLLKSGFYSVSEVSEMLGFKDSGYFNKIFKKYTGVTPGKYK